MISTSSVVGGFFVPLSRRPSNPISILFGALICGIANSPLSSVAYSDPFSRCLRLLSLFEDLFSWVVEIGITEKCLQTNVTPTSSDAVKQISLVRISQWVLVIGLQRHMVLRSHVVFLLFFSVRVSAIHR